MTRVCTICSHTYRQEIDEAILSGMSNRRIAAQWSLSENAVRRHKKAHIHQKVAKATAAREVIQAGTLLDQVRELLDKAHSLTEQAEEAGDLRTALVGVREIRGILELMAKVVGDLPAGPMIGIQISPEWIGIRTAILKALEPHSEARQAVIEALDHLPTASKPDPYAQKVTVNTLTKRSAPESLAPVRLSDLMGEGK
jgi:class 3 adenylate cyclase